MMCLGPLLARRAISCQEELDVEQSRVRTTGTYQAPLHVFASMSDCDHLPRIKAVANFNLETSGFSVNPSGQGIASIGLSVYTGLCRKEEPLFVTEDRPYPRSII